MSLSTTFGCPFEGHVPRTWSTTSSSASATSASTASRSPTPPAWRNPRQVARSHAQVLKRFPPPNETYYTLHFHNTRGMGLANVVAGIDAGVRSFDGSVGPRRLPVRARCDRQHLHRGHGQHARGHGVRHARRSRRSCIAAARRLPALVGHDSARPGDEGRQEHRPPPAATGLTPNRAAVRGRSASSTIASRTVTAARRSQPSRGEPRETDIPVDHHGLARVRTAGWPRPSL